MPSDDALASHDDGEPQSVDQADRGVAPILASADFRPRLGIRHLLLAVAMTFACLVVLGDSTSDRSPRAMVEISATALLYGAALSLVALLITWRRMGCRAALQPGEWLAALVAGFAAWHLVCGTLTYWTPRSPPRQQVTLGIVLIVAHCLAAATVLAVALAANTPRSGRTCVGVWKWLLNFGLALVGLHYVLHQLFPAEIWKRVIRAQIEIGSYTFSIYLTNIGLLIAIVAISLAIFLIILVLAVRRNRVDRGWLHTIGLAVFVLYVVGHVQIAFWG